MAEYDETMSGNNCSCNSFNEFATGGVDLGGSATVTDTIIRGGIDVGGSAFVDTGHPWDGMEAVWPLDGSYDGTANEVLDVGPHSFHGFAGDGTGNYCPAQDDGVFCLSSQYFGGRDWITFPPDGLESGQGFAVSCWVKIDPEHFYAPRVLFSRGFETASGDKWVFTLGYSFIHHVWAQVQLVGSDGDQYYEAYTVERMQQDQWHHVAASWRPGGSLRVYLDGIEGASIETAELATVALVNNNYAGRWNEGAYPVANIQDIRLHPVERSPGWFKAEHDNYCDRSFYFVGPVETAVLA